MATMAQAIRMALHYGETHLGITDIFGEDVGPPLGGVFTCTQGLKTAWNSPLDERGIIGCAWGLAMAGRKPVCEIQFCDYIFNTIDLLKLCGNTRWTSNGDWELPIVLMTPVGAGIHGSLYHSHSAESILSHIQGWKMVMPSTPLDAYGLMISAVKDPNPVMFLIPKGLMRFDDGVKIPGEPNDSKKLNEMIGSPVRGDKGLWQPRWPKLDEFEIPLGQANIVQAGDDVTLVTYGRMVHVCKKAIEETNGSVELIDLRTLYPYDSKTIFASVEKTGRLLIVNEDTEVTNFGEHILRRVIDDCFYALKVKPILLAGANVPGVGLAEPLEEASIPTLEAVTSALKELLEEPA